MVAQLYHLLESVVDEDEADERREAFLGEAREVLHQEAGVGGHQHQTEEARPQADPQPELEVVEAVVSGRGGTFATDVIHTSIFSISKQLYEFAALSHSDPT